MKILGNSISPVSDSGDWARAQHNARDLEIIDRNATRLNADADHGPDDQASGIFIDQQENRHT
jgi:hypothetical protein